MARFTAVFEQRERFWLAFVEELPGANATGETLDEVRANLEKAARHIIENNQQYVRGEVEGKSVIREELFVDV
jgi:predicted RNase H-like HicB family nuclease